MLAAAAYENVTRAGGRGDPRRRRRRRRPHLVYRVLYPGVGKRRSSGRVIAAQAQKQTRFQVESTVILFHNQTLKPGGAFILSS